VRESAWLLFRARPRPVRLTSGPMFFGPFVPSVDGQKLFADGWLLRGELVRYSKNAGQFQPFFTDISITDLDFSRDGQWVAYVTWPELTLWRSRVDGTERLQLTFLPVSPSLPRWSPDSKRIAYVDRGPGHLFKVCFISRDGGASHDLFPEHRQQSHPDWSPDGKRIVFGRDMELKGPTEEIAIHVLDLNSNQVSTIPGSAGLYAPRWSHDGQHVAALTADSKKLMLYDFKTAKWTNWISGVGAISFPSWSRDGQYINYDTSSKDVLAYRRSKIGQTRPEVVVDLNNLRRLGRWSGLAPDGSPLFIRDVSADDIYALDLQLP
jgi:dipeptidyl aminopeptidase/acylaminoacyl peptidase